MELDGIPAEKARTLLLRKLSEQGEGPQIVYGALRDWVWRMLTSRTYNAPLREWHDLVRVIATAASRRNETETATKLVVLGDLVLKTIRFHDVTPGLMLKKGSMSNSSSPFLRGAEDPWNAESCWRGSASARPISSGCWRFLKVPGW